MELECHGGDVANDRPEYSILTSVLFVRMLFFSSTLSLAMVSGTIDKTKSAYNFGFGPFSFQVVRAFHRAPWRPWMATGSPAFVVGDVSPS